MKNILVKTLVTLSWIYMLTISLIYFYLMLFDQGINETINSTHLNEKETLIMMIASVILLIYYPYQKIRDKVIKSYNDTINQYKKGAKMKKNQVPIINLK